MTSSAASDTDSARNCTAAGGDCAPRPQPADDLEAAAVGHVHVEQHDVGGRRRDDLDGLRDGRRVAHDVDEPVELRSHPGAKQLVVVDEDDADCLPPES